MVRVVCSVLAITLLILSCNTGEAVKVDFIPIFNPQSTGSKMIVPSDVDNPPPDCNPFFQFLSYTFGPILLGFAKNDTGLGNGDTITYDLYGNILDITIKTDEVTGTVEYSGNFRNDSSNVRLTVYPDGTFDYQQYVVFQDPGAFLISLGGWALLGLSMQNIPIDDQGYYHAKAYMKMLDPDNREYYEIDYFSGQGEAGHIYSGESDVCGLYVKTNRSKTNQPEEVTALTVDPQTIEESYFETFFTDIDSFNAAYEIGEFFYFDFNDNLYYQNMGPIPLLDNYTEDLPWELLP